MKQEYTWQQLTARQQQQAKEWWPTKFNRDNAHTYRYCLNDDGSIQSATK